jgi:PIN domain nuclease of toxin-antitoxin system
LTYLLDTATFLWASAQPAKLSRRARRICESPRDRLVVSVVSLWELVVKSGTGALRIGNPTRSLPEWVAQLGARLLPVEAAHAYAVYALGRCVW